MGGCWSAVLLSFSAVLARNSFGSHCYGTAYGWVAMNSTVRVFPLPAWIDRCDFVANEHGVIMSGDGRVGLGAVLILECRETGRFLLARKSFRQGYEMNHRFAFPGGMIRVQENTRSDLSRLIPMALEHRVLVESGLSFGSMGPIRALDQVPPVVATYTVRGQRVTTAIVAFYSILEAEVGIAIVGDGSTYDADWRDLDTIWPQIASANGISLAQLVWERLTSPARTRVSALLGSAARRAREDASRAGWPAPFIPWG